MGKSRLIVIDGLDGSGKGTQVNRVKEWLESKGVTVRILDYPNYSEPSSTLVKMYLNGEISDTPDEINAFAASSFYAVDRYISYIQHWKDDYERGDIVFLANRYVSSNLIHQMAKLDRDYWGDYEKWLYDYEFGKLGLPKPDMTIILDVPVDISQKLMAERYNGDENKKDLHESDLDYLARCHKTLGCAILQPCWYSIKCTENGVMRSQECITNDIISLIMYHNVLSDFIKGGD